MLSKSIERYHKYVQRGFTFDMVHYDRLKHLDFNNTYIMSKQHKTLQYINILPYDWKLSSNRQLCCNKIECIVCFYDTSCKHAHHKKFGNTDVIEIL